MLKNIKKDFSSLGKFTKLNVKISLIFVFTALIFSLLCFLFKDCFFNNYFFLYTVSEELLIVSRSCAFLGLIFFIIFLKIE